MDNILIATDLSPDNENVLCRAIQLAQASKAKLHILHVFYALRIPTVNPREMTAELNRRKAYLYELIEKYERKAPLSFAFHVVDEGRVYDRIGEYTLDMGADLVIIGKSDNGKETSFAVSTTTERICAESRVPVLVVSSDRDRPYHRILICADRPDIQKTGLGLVLRFASDAQITLLHMEKMASGILARLKSAYREWQYNRIFETMNAIIASKKSAKGRIIRKDVADMTPEMLAQESRDSYADLLVFKKRPSQTLAHKPDSLTRMLLRNTSADLLMVGRRKK